MILFYRADNMQVSNTVSVTRLVMDAKYLDYIILKMGPKYEKNISKYLSSLYGPTILSF